MESPRVIKGISAAPGLATGPVFVWREMELSLPAPYACEDDLIAWKKIRSAIKNAKEEILKIRSKVEQAAGMEEAAIFDAHLMMMEDMALHDMVRSALKNGINPEAAWHDAVEAFAAMVESIPDPTLSARGMDVRDVGRRVLAHLLGKSLLVNTLEEPSVVIARDLTPSQTAMIDHSMVLAFCTAEGGPTSHTAILSKALGIPAIVALGDSVLGVPSGELILVDANAGELTRQPTDDQWLDFEQRRKQVAGQIANDLKTASDFAITLDGKHVEVFANIGSVADALLAIEQGAEGVGLFRTEILYLNRSSMPAMDQQVEAYRQIIKALSGRTLVVRTLDIGGDKQVDYLRIISEPNPFLGWRGIRTITEQPERLKDQFYALLKAAQGTDLRIMLPMVSQVEEVLQARSLLNQALQALQEDISNFQIDLQFGIMVEVPSVALIIEHFAPLVDFFSIGTNDLTQYTLAMDRGNARVAPFASSFHPAVLRLIERTITVAHEHGKWVGMCGEFAGEPAAIPFLLGVELDEFSMSPAAIPRAKRIIRQLSIQTCKEIAKHTLSLAKTNEVESFLTSELKQLSNLM